MDEQLCLVTVYKKLQSILFKKNSEVEGKCHRIFQNLMQILPNNIVFLYYHTNELIHFVYSTRDDPKVLIQA